MMETTATMALLGLDGVGRKTVSRLWQVPHPVPSNAGDIFDWIQSGRSAGLRIPHITLLAVEQSLRDAERNLEDCETNGITVLAKGDGRFPPRLRDIPDAPLILFVKGDLSSLSIRSALAIIGTRDPTPFGRSAAERLAELFAKDGFVVVSGLAEGCDTQAHLGCLKAKGRTVAVMAHGLDRVYPRSNSQLAERIASEGGCLLSEYPLGTAPQRSSFVERDRIQSGLSQAVIVVETDVTGGTMHTVGFCREQRRLLACLCHPAKLLGIPQTRGNQKLIADGTAVPLATAVDIEALKARMIVGTSTDQLHAVPTATLPPSVETEPVKQPELEPIGDGVASKDQPSTLQLQEDFLQMLGMPTTPSAPVDVPRKRKPRKQSKRARK